jgi:hypothetical protein
MNLRLALVVKDWDGGGERGVGRMGMYSNLKSLSKFYCIEIANHWYHERNTEEEHNGYVVFYTRSVPEFVNF